MRLPRSALAVVDHRAGRRLKQQRFRIIVGAESVDEKHPLPDPGVGGCDQCEGGPDTEPAQAGALRVHVVLLLQIEKRRHQIVHLAWVNPVAQAHGWRPLVHHDVARAGQRIAQIDDFGGIESLVVHPQGQQRRGARLAARDPIDLGHGGSFRCRIAHLVAQRFICEPGLGLDRRIQHLGEEQRGMETGAALGS